MNLYLLTRPDGADYDEYNSAVVCAESEAHARDIHPSGCRVSHLEPAARRGSWVESEQVKVELIGHAVPLLPECVVCASFNAG